MGWYNAGTDQKSDAPNLFGCVQLPDPSSCFGHSESTYSQKHRDTLIKLLEDDKNQTMPWPATLRACFSSIPNDVETGLYGSPMLDGALGQVNAVEKVLYLLKRKDFSKDKSVSVVKNKGKLGLKESRQQFDNILPPEMPTNWVQCESCKKWRRVGWHIDSESLPDKWFCEMNTWDAEGATCSAPQDSYDPEKESILEFKVTTEVFSKESEIEIGAYRDVFCNSNRIYYEAQIKKVKKSKVKDGKAKILFHFQGWSPKFDEWIDFDSDRIQPHNMYTNPNTNDPREQEKWQGLFGIKPVIRSAFHTKSSKKRKLESSLEIDQAEELKI